MKLTLPQKLEIVEAVQSRSTTMTELARKYNVSVAAISYTNIKFTGHRVKPLNILSQSDKETIVKELQARKTTIKNLAGRYRVSVATIRRAFKEITGRALFPNLSQNTRENIVAELLTGKTDMVQVAAKNGVAHSTIERTFKRQTGRTLTEQKSMLDLALWDSPYRAWHTGEKKLYPVLGVDWLHRKLLTLLSAGTAWLDLKHFVLMEWSGLRDRKRTPEYPDGQKIYGGDIVQFPINLDGKLTMVRGTVVFERESGWFSIPEIDDGEVLALHNDECEVIGTIYENPNLIPQAA
jgi:transposase-like protein